MDARAEVQSGALRGPRLRDRLRAIPFVDRDAWVDRLLGIEDVPDDIGLPRGSVPYLPCGVEEILALVDEVPVTANDHVVDLGSGLGRVVILAHLLTGARGTGIELQPALVEAARAHSAGLALDRIAFIQGDAAEADLEGSIFFLYAPFSGPTLARVLERLSQKRSIVVATVGLELRDVPWLTPRKTSTMTLNVYDSP